MRTIYLSMTCITIALCATNVAAQKLDRLPYPQNMQLDSVEILWRTDVPAESYVEIREPGGVPKVYESNVPTILHQILIPGLKPDTKYQYRVGPAEGKFFDHEPFTIQTFPAPDAKPAPFSFVAFGDHRNFPVHHREVVDAITTTAMQRGWPRFAIDTGDYTGSGDNKIDYWNT